MGKVRVLVYDTTGATLQGALKNATNIHWEHPLAGEGDRAGNATFSVLASDSQASLIVRDRIVKMHWNNGIRVGFRIHRIVRVLTDQGFRLDVIALQLRCMLGDAVTLPEYGVRIGAGETRRFGFMSAVGAWYVGADWHAPTVTPLSSYARWPTYPQGYPDAGSSWLGPTGSLPPVGGTAWYRGTFTTATTYQTVRLYVSTDDAADVYLDGDLVLQIPAAPDLWKQTSTVDVPLPVGSHVLAVQMRDEVQITGESLRGEVLCCLASVTASTSTSAIDGVSVSAIIFRSSSSVAWKVRYDNTTDPGWRKAQIVKLLFIEAQGRSVRGPSALTLDFTDLIDSAGVSWTDRGDYELQTLSDPFDRQTELLFDPSIDWDVDAATMKLQAWNRRGTLRTGSHSTPAGVGPVVFRLRADLTDLSVAETYDVTTSLYGRTADGLVVHVSDSTAQSQAGGVVEGGMSLGSVATTNTATDVMTAHLTSLGYPASDVTAALSPNGPVPYVDYFLGDTCVLDAGPLGYLPVRVLAITVDASGDVVTAIPTLALDRTVTL